MENHPTTEGDAHGLSPEPAGSKPIGGKRLCPSCHGYRFLFPLAGRQPEIKCPVCEGTGFEPTIASRPGSSLFSPPAPPQQLEGRRAALSDDEKRLVLAFKEKEAAYLRIANIPYTVEERIFQRRALEFWTAAEHLARSLIERAEGGLNK